MKNNLKYFLIIAIMVCSSTTNAQWFKKLGDKLLKKAEKKTEQRIEKMADKKTDKALDSVFKEKKEKRKKGKVVKKKKTSENDFSDLLMSSTKEIEIPDSYNFDTTITIDRFGKGVGKNKTMLQRIGKTATLTEIPSTKMILDNELNAMITLLEDTKEAQVISLDMLGGFMKMGNQNEEEHYEEPVITSLGSTVVIAGYKCKHMSITTSEQQIDLWYTNEVNIDMSAYMSMFKSFPQTVKNTQDEITSRIDGFVMQMDIINKETDIFFGTKVTDISFEKTRVNMSNYKILKH